jgi:hypothetical protein
MNLSKQDYDEIRGMLSDALNDLPRLCCEDFHHGKKDRHTGNICPVSDRFNRNMDKLCSAFGLEREE